MRLLHTMLRVGDLDKSLAFYTEVLNMKLLRRKDYPDGRFTLIETECLGSCADAPICLINDKRVESFMDNAKLDALIDELRNKERH